MAIPMVYFLFRSDIIFWRLRLFLEILVNLFLNLVQDLIRIIVAIPELVTNNNYMTVVVRRLLGCNYCCSHNYFQFQNLYEGIRTAYSSVTPLTSK